MAKEKDENATGKGQLGKPKKLAGTPRSLIPDVLNDTELDAKQDRMRVRRKKGPELDNAEARGLFDDSLPDEEEPPTDCED